MKAERVLDFLISAVGTAWIQFIMIVLVVAMANYIRAQTPTILGYVEPKAPEPACEQIVLPPLPVREGWLPKRVDPHTNNLGAWALFLDGRADGPFIFKVTAYNEHDRYTPGRTTASGFPVMEGITVACGPELDLGTVIVLENGMILRCLDRGGWITRGRLDIYFNTLDEASSFGVQDIEGMILK